MPSFCSKTPGQNGRYDLGDCEGEEVDAAT